MQKTGQYYKITMGEGGRIVIPAACRKALGIKPGDTLSLRVQDRELRLIQQQEALRKLQEMVKDLPGVSVDDFLAWRKEQWD